MGKVVGAISMSLVLASAGAAWCQEIGIVSAAPNAATGELIVDIPARPDGEKIYIVREGTLVTEATIKTSGDQGGAVISLPTGTATVVQVGDRVSLSPSLARQLPASAYDIKPVGDALPMSPGQKQLAAAAAKNVVVTTEVGAPEPPPAAVPGPEIGHAQLEKTTHHHTMTHTVSAIMAEPTPRGMGVPLFPAPVQAEAGIMAPYGQGLAAAAPVGTPYLRSPAFAGPPVIYMPQTVTRVLLPGATPYPSNIMSPPAQYVYASAPFLRTDIYTSLPYGTFYWPQGYAGTTPVEPQVPAYVTAPASAIMSTEAAYAAGRYIPGVANNETLNPIAAGINSNLVSSTVLVDGEAGTAASVSTSVMPPEPPLTVVRPGPGASLSTEATLSVPPMDVNPFPIMSDSIPTSAMTPVVTVTTPAVVPLIPTPAIATPMPGLPVLPDMPPAPTGLPDLPAVSATPGATSALEGLPTLPADSTQVAAALPALPPTAATPASMVPSLPTPAVPVPANVIVVDNSAPGALTLTPPQAWTPSASTAESHQGGSMMAKVDPAQVKSATFNADIPADDQYEIALWWVPGVPQFRSTGVPVTINTATGPQQITVDQTQTGQWHVIGTYQLKAGQKVPVAVISTDGIAAAGNTVSVSVDAIRLTPR